MAAETGTDQGSSVARLSPPVTFQYVRVSTEEQSKEGVSLEAQQERIKAYALAHNLQLIHIYCEQGISGKVPLRQRPEGAKLVQDILKKRAKHVLALKLDRLFRNTNDALDQTEYWDKAKTALHIVDMGGKLFDPASASGRMMLTMMAGFARMERDLISERTKTALAHKKSNSRAYTRITPLGFDRHGDELVENKEEMETVRTILQMRANGHSMQTIADKLNESGAQTKQGGTWHAVTIQKVLKIHTGKRAA